MPATTFCAAARATNFCSVTGDDRLVGDAGNDHLFGDITSLDADGGNDTLSGGPGDDFLSSGEANDRLFGEAGNDSLQGGRGADELRGGEGADTFQFRSLPGTEYDTGVGAGNSDRIIDFGGTEGDKIDVRLCDADLTVGGNQRFTFAGEDTLGKGEIGFFETATRTIVLANTDNDAAAEFEIQLNGIGHDLSADDFLL